MPKLLRQQPGSVGQYFEEHHQQGRCFETWVTKCGHCQHLTEFFTLAEKKEAHVCYKCMRLICESCLARPCIVDEEQIRLEERIAARVATKSEIEKWLSR